MKCRVVGGPEEAVMMVQGGEVAAEGKSLRREKVPLPSVQVTFRDRRSQSAEG